MEQIKTDNQEGIAKLFSDFEKAKEKNSKSGSSSGTQKAGGLAKYFKPQNERETFRVLPPLDLPNGKKRDYIEYAFFHYSYMNDQNGKRRQKYIYCPAHNDPRVPRLDEQGNPVLDKEGKPVTKKAHCPLCEHGDKLLKTQDQSIRGIKKEDLTPEQEKIKKKNDDIYKEASNYLARKYYIVRGVDKGAMKDGVKFYRFPHNKKNQGVYSKFVGAMQIFMNEHGVDFSDVKQGADFTIMATETESNRGFKYWEVTNISPSSPKPLTTDDQELSALLSDDITWRDVFRPKRTKVLDTQAFLERVVKGTNPYWDDSDSENKRWVYPDPADAELEVAENTRDRNLDADSDDDYELASDVVETSITAMMSTEKKDISEMTSEDVGTFNNMGAEVEDVDDDSDIVDEEETQAVEEEVVTKKVAEPVAVEEEEEEDDEEWGDLPF